MEAIKVLIADDHSMIRAGLVGLLEMQEDFTVVGQAGDGLEAVEEARDLQPDVILMDLRMPELGGVEALRRIRAEDPHIKVVILTAYDTDEYVFQAIKAAANGYVLKDISREELFQAVRAAHRGEFPLHPSVSSRVLNRLGRLSYRADPDALSERELVVLRLVAAGATNKKIASDLSITEGTVRTHVANIFQKLGVNDRTKAMTTAIQKGILNL